MWIPKVNENIQCIINIKDTLTLGHVYELKSLRYEADGNTDSFYVEDDQGEPYFIPAKYITTYFKEVVDPIPEGVLDETVETSEEKFQKFDGSKNRLELIEPEYILGTGKILTFGAEKYAANNWKKMTTEDVERIKGSILRHTMAYLSGEKTDPESGESHLYHMSCNLMFLDYFDRKSNGS